MSTESGISQVVCLEAHTSSASMGPAGVNVPDDCAWLSRFDPVALARAACRSALGHRLAATRRLRVLRPGKVGAQHEIAAAGPKPSRADQLMPTVHHRMTHIVRKFPLGGRRALEPGSSVSIVSLWIGRASTEDT